jgi:hypothetical protein
MYTEHLLFDILLSVFLGIITVLLRFLGFLDNLYQLYLILALVTSAEFFLAAFYTIKNRDNGCCCFPVKKLIIAVMIAAPFGYSGVLLHISFLPVLFALLFLSVTSAVFSVICSVRLVDCCADRGCEIELHPEEGNDNPLENTPNSTEEIK